MTGFIQRRIARRHRNLAATFLGSLIVATSAAAQVTPTGAPAADILLSRAIAEQRVFHSCSALDPPTHRLVVDAWAQDAAAAASILAENNVPPEAIAAFTTAAATEALLPAPDTPFEDVLQLCTSNPGWLQDLQQFDFLILSLTLPQAFE